MLYRTSPITPPRLLLRIATTAGTGALVGVVACSSRNQNVGVCYLPFGDDGPSGGSSSSGGDSGNPGSIEFGDATDTGAESGVMDAGADSATDGGGSTDADACAPSGGCTAACVAGRHNVTVMVDGCLVTECCVPDDAGADSATGAAADASAGDAADASTE